MKHLRHIFVLALFSLIISSCASYHVGYITDSASLSSDNFSYVERQLQGSSEADYYFTFGSINKESLVQEAKAAILEEHPLEDNQALANITVEYRTQNYLFYVYIKRICTVTADIVAFE